MPSRLFPDSALSAQSAILVLFGSCFVAVAARSQPAPSATGITIDSGYVPVNGSRLFYEAAGRGPPVVLLHSGYLGRRMWDDQFAEFARTHRVVRYDARGYGSSGPPTTPYVQADDLYAVLKALGIRRASLVGVSLGGGTAIDFALAHPDMVDRLVLSGPGVSGYQWPPVNRNEPWRVTARAALAQHDTTGVAISWIASDYLAPAAEQAALATRLRELLAANVSVWKYELRGEDHDTLTAAPAMARLGGIRVPTLLVVGTRDDPDILKMIDSLQTKLPNARTVTFEGAGHVPNMEQPDKFARAVLRFLDSP